MPHTSPADRLIELAEHARALGRTRQADMFLLLAWIAYEGAELPVGRCHRGSKGAVAPQG